MDVVQCTVGIIGSHITVGAAVGTVVKTAIGTVTITTPTKAKEIVTSPDEIRNRILFLLCQLRRLNVSGPASGLLAREEVCQEGRESLLDLLDDLRGQRGLKLLQLLLQLLDVGSELVQSSACRLLTAEKVCQKGRETLLQLRHDLRRDGGLQSRLCILQYHAGVMAGGKEKTE